MTNVKVSIEDAVLLGYHGVFRQESVVGNEFSITVDVIYDCDSVSINDEVESTISYADIFALIKREFAITSQLLETVAHRILRVILKNWDYVTHVRVKISKLSPPIQNFNGKASVEVNYLK